MGGSARARAPRLNNHSCLHLSCKCSEAPGKGEHEAPYLNTAPGEIGGVGWGWGSLQCQGPQEVFNPVVTFSAPSQNKAWTVSPEPLPPGSMGPQGTT